MNFYFYNFFFITDLMANHLLIKTGLISLAFEICPLLFLIWLFGPIPPSEIRNLTNLNKITDLEMVLLSEISDIIKIVFVLSTSFKWFQSPKNPQPIVNNFITIYLILELFYSFVLAIIFCVAICFVNQYLKIFIPLFELIFLGYISSKLYFHVKYCLLLMKKKIGDEGDINILQNYYSIPKK